MNYKVGHRSPKVNNRKIIDTSLIVTLNTVHYTSDRHDCRDSSEPNNDNDI